MYAYCDLGQIECPVAVEDKKRGTLCQHTKAKRDETGFSPVAIQTTCPMIKEKKLKPKYKTDKYGRKYAN